MKVTSSTNRTFTRTSRLNNSRRENEIKKVKTTFLFAENAQRNGSHEHILYICSREHIIIYVDMFVQTTHTFARTYNRCSCERLKVDSSAEFCDLANFFNFLRSTKVEPINVGSPF